MARRDSVATSLVDLQIDGAVGRVWVNLRSKLIVKRHPDYRKTGSRGCRIPTGKPRPESGSDHKRLTPERSLCLRNRLGLLDGTGGLQFFQAETQAVRSGGEPFRSLVRRASAAGSRPAMTRAQTLKADSLFALYDNPPLESSRGCFSSVRDTQFGENADCLIPYSVRT